LVGSAAVQVYLIDIMFNTALLAVAAALVAWVYIIYRKGTVIAEPPIVGIFGGGGDLGRVVGYPAPVATFVFITSVPAHHESPPPQMEETAIATLAYAYEPRTSFPH
jgi:hypothetical protein